MTPNQREAIERHGRQLLAIFPNATEQDPVKLCRKLRRIETRAHRHAEMMCSDAAYYSEHIEREEQCKADRDERAVRKLLGSGRPFINSDPRGYALKVELRGERECKACEGCGGFVTVAPMLEVKLGIAPAMERSRCEPCSGSGHLPAERLHTDMGGYGILAPEIGHDGR